MELKTSTKVIFVREIDNNLSLVIPSTCYAQEIYNLINRDRDHLRIWLPWVDNTQSALDTSNNLMDRINGFSKKDSAAFYAVYDNQFVASVGFVCIDNVNKKGAIGYWLLSEFQNKGIMTKCVEACIDYGFKELNLNRIEIKCSSKNIKSSNIPKKLGFKLDGVLRENHMVNDTLHDTLVFGLLKSEWKSK